MTATAEPPLRPVEAPSEAVLDRAEGVELLGDVHGSGYKDGAALVRRADGQMVQLGPLMYAVLDCVDGRRTTAELADCLSEREGRRFDVQHVARLAEKLAEQGLLAGTEHKAPPRRNPLLALRWKVLVTNPAVTRRLTTPFTFLFRPFVVVPVVAAFVAVLWFVLVHKGVAAATADAFHKPELLLLVFALAVASAGFHEIGHASACRYGGAEPAGMGMGIYMVWPAFYTDVTDAYRLPRRDRLRVDLGGIYFNAIVAVATMGVWLAWHVDALLLLIAIQLLEMVKNLSPVIRSDGYHILSDATGVPDLYFHIGPTLRRLLPWRRMEPSALSGRARLLVTAWVLVVVPVLLSLMLGAILLLPHLLASTWESTRTLGSAVPHEAAHGHGLAVLTSLLRLFALVLPVVGSVLITQKIVRMLVAKGRSWSAGSPPRRVLALAAGAAVCAGAAFAWWPAGQYQPVRADQHGTIASFGAWIAAPQQAARPAAAPPAPVHITPGTHLAVSMIPVGGATKEHPAMFVIAGQDGQPAVAILTDTTPADATATTTDTTTTTTTATTTTSSGGSAPVQAAAFAFTLPSKPGPGDSQALSVNTTSGGVKYDVAYSLVTISDGSPVTNKNSAFAFANCVSCTTVAVSFQVVLIVGQSNRIAPINAAGALNGNCTACMTTAIADQIVITLRSVPSQELLQRLQDALQQLNALPALGANGTPAAVASVVAKVQQQIDDALAQSGLVANPPPTTTASTATATTATATTGSTATAPAVTATTPTTPATTSSSTTTSTRTATTATTTTTPATTSTAGTTTGATTTTG